MSSSFTTALRNTTLELEVTRETGEIVVHVERTDNQLVELVKAGDTTAFEQIFDRHKRMVGMVASRYFRRAEEVEEIIQISFSKVFAELRGFRGSHERSLASWIVRITSNACFDQLRTQKRRSEKLDCDLSESEAELLLELTAVDSLREEQALLDRDLTEKLLANLSSIDRSLLNMLYAEEMSVAEIASALGWSKSNVKIRAWRARAAMRKALKNIL